MYPACLALPQHSLNMADVQDLSAKILISTVEPLLSRWSGSYHCPYLENICNLGSHANNSSIRNTSNVAYCHHLMLNGQERKSLHNIHGPSPGL